MLAVEVVAMGADLFMVHAANLEVQLTHVCRHDLHDSLLRVYFTVRQCKLVWLDTPFTNITIATGLTSPRKLSGFTPVVFRVSFVLSPRHEGCSRKYSGVPRVGVSVQSVVCFTPSRRL